MKLMGLSVVFRRQIRYDGDEDMNVDTPGLYAYVDFGRSVFYR